MRPVTGALLWTLALLVACHGKAEITDETQGGDADTDADSDSDADADTDADSDSDTDTDTAVTGISDTAATIPTETASEAACAVAIPADAIVVKKDQVASTAGLYWVCKNATLSYSGPAARIVVASNGSLVLSGTATTVWAESGADLAVVAPGNSVYQEGGVDLVDKGGTYKYACVDVVVDDSAAPNPGC